MTILKESYPVLGIECASCVKKIESVLNKTEGVINVGVNFASEKVLVEYDDEKISLTELANVLKKIGYELIT
ncbi:Copper-exporting P-type ATPase [subsurface metagenome]